MTEERDDKVSASYRALGREEPPRALDEAILAAARRRPSFASRWAVPVSLAAVVMLSVTVTVMVREEAPELLSTATMDKAAAPAVATPEKKLREAEAAKVEPARGADAPKAKASEADSRNVSPQKAEAPKLDESKADVGALAMRAPSASGERAKLMKEQVAQTEKLEARERPAERPSFVPDPAPASNRAAVAGTASGTPPPAEAAAPARSAAQLKSSAPSAPPPAAAVAPAAPAPQMAQRRFDEGARDRAERQVPAEATAKRMQDAVETPEKWLERIAELRAAGKHEEADKALADFRKRHPDYRISESMLQRVERRSFAR